MSETTNAARQPRRMAREPKTATETAAKKSPMPAKAPSRLDQLEQLVVREGGASIAEMVEATGWLQHSVRGALAGALKRRGLTICSDKVEGVRRYHGVMAP